MKTIYCRHFFYVCMLFIYLLTACASTDSVTMQANPQKKIDKARTLMSKKDYLKAITELNGLIRRFPAHEITDDAHFYLSLAYYHNKDFGKAVYEITSLFRDFSESPFVEEGQYWLGMCYYKQSLNSQLDQQETESAIEEFKQYLEDYPNGSFRNKVLDALKLCKEKLGKKIFDNAKFYFRQKEYKAAIIYCNDVINTFGDTSWKQKALELQELCEQKLNSN